MISSRESEWGEHGATHVRIVFKDGNAELALPDGALAVRALRGKGFRRAPMIDGKRGVTDAFRFPLFPSSARRILARGRAANELVSIHVPRSAYSRVDEPHLHRLQGPVLAASVLGNRIVAVIEQERMIRVQVSGKTLGRVKSMSIPVEAADLEPEDIEKICAEGLAPLYYKAEDVVCPFGDDWWRLRWDDAQRTDFGAIAPAVDGGFDRLNHVRRGQRHSEWCIPGRTGQIGPKGEIVLGGGGCAWCAGRCHGRAGLQSAGRKRLQGCRCVSSPEHWSRPARTYPRPWRSPGSGPVKHAWSRWRRCPFCIQRIGWIRPDCRSPNSSRSKSQNRPSRRSNTRTRRKRRICAP